MADTTPQPVESQKERWVKYGANVALTILIAVILAGFLIYIAQTKNIRSDTTAGGVYSLKPQTRTLLRELPARMWAQHAQSIADADLGKVISQLDTMNGAPPTTTKPATQPTQTIAPAISLRDQLLSVQSATTNALKNNPNDAKKSADDLRRKLEEAARNAAAGGQAVPAARQSDWSQIVSTLDDAARRLKDFKPQIQLVSLFSTARREGEAEKKVADDSREVRSQQVADLLREYGNESNGAISVEVIDPVTEPAKQDVLFNAVAKKYGNDYKRYEDLMAQYPKTVEEIAKLAKTEVEALQKLPEPKDQESAEMIGQLAVTVGLFPVWLDQLKGSVEAELKLKVPNYKGAADAIRERMTTMKEAIDALLEQYKTARANPKTPAEMKAHFQASEPRLTGIKKLADDLLGKMQDLGEMKQLDDLRRNRRDSVVVMGPNDLKIIPSEEIFEKDENRFATGVNVRDRFAGEQLVSTSLYSLTARAKIKVAFIRSGGPPITARIPQGGYVGPFSRVADRLRRYDIDVIEKDMSGQWAMQAMQMQMQGMPVPPDARDEELADAVWIILSTKQDPRAMMQNPGAGQIGMKVAQHLEFGGSALLMLSPEADRMPFLKDWGIEIKPEYVLVHEKITVDPSRREGGLAQYVGEQPVFVINDYGDHLLAKPLRSLDTFLAHVVPVNTVDAKGAKTSKLMPIPKSPPIWGDTDVALSYEFAEMKFDAKKPNDVREGDIKGDFFAGAASERDGKGRLVVIGSIFPFNTAVNATDVEESTKQRRPVLRFPGNAELFYNSVFWLGKLDTMIAISPAALEVPRVSPQMSQATQNVWRFGVAIVLLPLLALAAGAFVYLKRRD